MLPGSTTDSGLDVQRLRPAPHGAPAPARGGLARALKHALDRAFGAVAFVALAPLLVATAVALQLDGARPVVVRRTRYGEGGRPFGLLSFEVPAGKRHLRRWRLAEAWGLLALPQLVNVARGEVSLVGPRPRREGTPPMLTVRPGLTGAAQAERLRRRVTPAEAALLDGHYVADWSVRADARILASTVWRAVVPQRD